MINTMRLRLATIAQAALCKTDIARLNFKTANVMELLAPSLSHRAIRYSSSRQRSYVTISCLLLLVIELITTKSANNLLAIVIFIHSIQQKRPWHKKAKV
ncbi:hypothetical protein HR45_17735 [Shewanella mangrovi]|uniref:Uncharacterized protein n=1 Tax=Shewanella mangrovi TaxID=1515746 RepID=A0A094LM94_9GAMM|nr:hypothetical protein HR45_17735 [Shewanella mangrovi]